jgi:hypothetical protein
MCVLRPTKADHVLPSHSLWECFEIAKRLGHRLAKERSSNKFNNNQWTPENANAKSAIKRLLHPSHVYVFPSLPQLLLLQCPTCSFCSCTPRKPSKLAQTASSLLMPLDLCRRGSGSGNTGRASRSAQSTQSTSGLFFRRCRGFLVEGR